MSHISYNRKISVFCTDTGKKPFYDWFAKIKDNSNKVRIIRRLDQLEKGHYGDCKRLPSGLYELRFFFGPGQRIYFTERGRDVVLLLMGGNKKSQKKDIKQALQYLEACKNTTNEVIYV